MTSDEIGLLGSVGLGDRFESWSRSGSKNKLVVNLDHFWVFNKGEMMGRGCDTVAEWSRALLLRDKINEN